tara:strand:+ start:7743 stop:8264 length:522 start_codon:yes stop_codon:yes gene_type:complete
MFKSRLTNSETNNFCKIHNILIPKRTKRFETYDIVYSQSKSPKKIYTITESILDKSIKILNQNNLTNYDSSFYSIEFHQRNCGFEKKPYQWSRWHRDDYSSVYFNVYTIIFYIRKDKTVKNGNLDYQIGETKFTHIIKEGDILCFTGNILHKPQSTSGFGCRDIIICFIKRID